MTDKIKWYESYDKKVHEACVGNISLMCFAQNEHNKKWYARIRNGSDIRRGPIRHSLDKAKEDAFNLAKNMLEDLMHGLKKEMVSFGIGDMWDG